MYKKLIILSSIYNNNKQNDYSNEMLYMWNSTF